MSEFQPRSPCCREASPDPEKLCSSCADYRSFRRDVLKSEEEPYRPPPGFEHISYQRLKGLPPLKPEKKKKGSQDELV